MESGKVRVSTLGQCTLTSPLPMSTRVGDGIGNFVPEDTWVRYRIVVSPGTPGIKNPVEPGPLFEKAGPREKLFFDPGRTRAAVVTCGGLCPGLNNVLRSLYLEMHHNYGVPEVLGIRYGFRGLNPLNGHEPLRLTPDRVERIDKQGGTILGTSRGVEDPAAMVDFLRSEKVQILFCVGGDGTLRGAHHLHEEIARQGARSPWAPATTSTSSATRLTRRSSCRTVLSTQSTRSRQWHRPTSTATAKTSSSWAQIATPISSACSASPKGCSGIATWVRQSRLLRPQT